MLGLLIAILVVLVIIMLLLSGMAANIRKGIELFDTPKFKLLEVQRDIDLHGRMIRTTLLTEQEMSNRYRIPEDL